MVRMAYNRENAALPTPTCWHFETNTSIVIPATDVGMKERHMRGLTAQGRAICRIMYAHGWYAARIAAMFGISQGPIARAIRNTYSPPDDLSRDYHFAGGEFFEKYPPPHSAPLPEVSNKTPKTLADEPAVFWPKAGPVEVIEILDSDDELDELEKEYENDIRQPGLYREAMNDLAATYTTPTATPTVIKRSPGPDGDLLQVLIPSNGKCTVAA
ncbi:hypothetical protein C8R43DRAFT_1043428 [Mycena crocata]|nr:hypothetical protein C8R43DRAFT_1043428 [Mycena crocata]